MFRRHSSGFDCAGYVGQDTTAYGQEEDRGPLPIEQNRSKRGQKEFESQVSNRSKLTVNH